MKPEYFFYVDTHHNIKKIEWDVKFRSGKYSLTKYIRFTDEPRSYYYNKTFFVFYKKMKNSYNNNEWECRSFEDQIHY
jgi:hypothetical protein